MPKHTRREVWLRRRNTNGRRYNYSFRLDPYWEVMHDNRHEQTLDADEFVDCVSRWREVFEFTLHEVQNEHPQWNRDKAIERAWQILGLRGRGYA